MTYGSTRFSPSTVLHNARHIGDDDHPLHAEMGSDRAGRRIRIDVVALSRFVDAERRDDRHVAHIDDALR